MEREKPEHQPSGDQSRAGAARSLAAGGMTGLSNRAMAGVLGSGRSAGEPLPAKLAGALGESLGTDLSGVRLHTDEASAQAAGALSAEAFSIGPDIHFGAGRFDPASPAGLHLLRHEVAHAAQPSPVVDAAEGLTVSDPADRAERRAEAFACGGAGDVGARRALVHRSTGVESPDRVSHQPQHRNQAVAVWDSTLASTVRTGAMIGELTNAVMGAVDPAAPEVGHYSTEAAAIAAVRAYAKVGVVFLEDGRYVAYHASDDSLVYDFSWDNVRWTERKPWTAVRFTSSATAIITQDGVTLRPEMYTSEDEAESRLADQALMPGADNPFSGHLALRGDFNKLGEDKFVGAFELAMRDHALAVLARSQALVQREAERRAPGTNQVPAEEMALMRRTAEYLAGLDAEMAAIPKDLPMWPGEMADFEARQLRFHALKDRRRVVLARYPMLARVNAGEFSRLSPEEQNKQLHGEAGNVLRDIDRTRDNIIDGDLDLWTMRPIVESTLAALGITDTDRRAWAIAKHDAERREDTIISIAMSVLSVGFGLAAAFATGGLAVAFAAGALGLGAADAMMATEKYFTESAAGNTAMNPDESLVPPDLAGHWAWLVVAWLGVVADAADVIRAVRAAKAAGAVGGGIDALAAGNEALAKRLRVAAGEFADGELISEATKVTVGNRVGAAIEINEALGTEVRVHYSVTSRGDVLVEGIRCGARSTIVDILAHAEVVQLLRRYEGVTGKIRRLYDRLLSLAGFAPLVPFKFPAGSAAFESYLELRKLPEIIEARRAALGASLGTESEAALRRDVEFLEAEYNRHAEVVDAMTIEKGAGFVAKAEERTAEAITNGMPRLDGDALISDASRYYYRSNPGGSPPYILCRISTADVPSRTLVPDGAGGWKIAEGGLSRGEQAVAMVGGWPTGVKDAFNAYQAAHAGRVVVPLQGVATAGKTIGQLAPDIGERLRVLLQEAFTRAGDPDAANKALDAAQAVANHQVVVVRGTDQLRAYKYRLNFTGSADELAEVDLHHIIPLQLGGDHRRLVAVHQDLHDRLHDLIDEIPFGQGTLAPHSIRSSADLSFTEGAAVLKPDGTVQLARMNPDGTFTLVP